MDEVEWLRIFKNMAKRVVAVCLGVNIIILLLTAQILCNTLPMLL